MIVGSDGDFFNVFASTVGIYYTVEVPITSFSRRVNLNVWPYQLLHTLSFIFPVQII